MSKKECKLEESVCGEEAPGRYMQRRKMKERGVGQCVGERRRQKSDKEGEGRAKIKKKNKVIVKVLFLFFFLSP